MASPLARQSEPLEQLPVRQPRVLIDFTAPLQCQVLDVLDSILRRLECGLSEDKTAEAVYSSCMWGEEMKAWGRGGRRGRNWLGVGRVVLLPDKVSWPLITVWVSGEENPGRGGKEKAGTMPRDKGGNKGARELLLWF